MDGKPFAVKVEGYPGWFFFDYRENVAWFMKLCGEDGSISYAFERNELGQYEPIWVFELELNEEG